MKEIQRQIRSKIDQLSPAEQVEVDHFVEFLLQRKEGKPDRGKKRRSLLGIWKGNDLDDDLFAEARRAVFPYEDRE